MRWLLLSAVLFLVACNTERIAQLEKENKDLRKQLEDAKHVDLATQERCSNAAQRFLEREYSPDKDTILLTQLNHYNAHLGICFITVEWHYRDPGSKTGSWYNSIMLRDVYGNQKYAEFSEHTMIGLDFKSIANMFECTVGGKKCSTIQEFNQSVNPFMSE
jgi:hypothetical protein